MKVVELIIDGYKSYAVRTVISGWDPTFNAITGLNGSGKSNILDSICFVLGITNMSTVRAQNLQDLIYKRGQAGVTKASVTIVFDNNDKTNSPIGFEEYAQISVTRQIVLGGTSKYLINGHRAQQATVQNLFQSVGLNINNPNFLIMQGRITKVLNMKSAEILAMIEEAAGTRMFEDRKEKANKTMAKKEMKVVEIEGLLKEEIEPKLEKLRGEKRAWLDYQKTQGELERLTRVVVAADYVKAGEKARSAGDEHVTKRAKVQHLEDNADKLKREIENLEQDIIRVRATREKELRKGGRFQALENQVKEHSHELVRLSTVLDLKQSSVAEEEQRRKEVAKSVKDLESLLRYKKAAYDKLQVQFDGSKAQLNAQNAEVEQKEELLSTLQTGVASREGQESGYQGQLQDARSRASAASTEQEQAKLKIAHLEKRVKEDEPKARKAKVQNADLLNGLENLRQQAAKLETDLKKLGFEPGQEQKMREQETSLQKNVRAFRQEADGLKRKVANVDFNYSDPSPNFDRSKVKGLVAQLFTLDKNKTQAGTALEICAGGRLYNVVVDSAETGTQLLQNGKLKKRVTIIPLNKISAFKASAAKVGAAQQLAPGKVDLALSLIGYDHEVSAAMDYVFGTTLICQDAETAKRVTFDPSVRLKSVTLEGDVYDPSGTLSGGSSPNSSGVLVILQQLHEVTANMQASERELQDLQEMMQHERSKLDTMRGTQKQLDLKKHEVKLTEEQISGNSSSSIINAVEEMKMSIVQLKTDMADAKTRQTEASKDVKRIEKDMADFSNNKDSKLQELEKSLADLKKNLSKDSASVKTMQKTLQDSRVESEQAMSDLTAAEEQLTEIDASIQSMKDELDALRQEESQVKKEQDIALAELSDEQAKLTGFDDELKELETAKSKKSKQITEESLEAQKLSHSVEKLQKDAQAASQLVVVLEKEHEWIADNKDQFGRPGTAYDFQGRNLAESRATLKNVTERFQGMKKKINPKVMPMIDSVEKKEASLKNMLRTVVRDKKKIEETISTLDEYKKEALLKTWTKVTEDFGNIFSDLLPGNNTAKLVPIDGDVGRIQEGLEVKVCLGKVWKQSLNELSGGQRSLIALSLILALLQFKPAPMYILDEVDAALDLSHTQNIGRLIKTRFKGSQFVVVSLKDGMFQNANRVFRTRFSEGTSVVSVMTPALLSNAFQLEVRGCEVGHRAKKVSAQNDNLGRNVVDVCIQDCQQQDFQCFLVLVQSLVSFHAEFSRLSLNTLVTVSAFAKYPIDQTTQTEPRNMAMSLTNTLLALTLLTPAFSQSLSTITAPGGCGASSSSTTLAPSTPTSPLPSPASTCSSIPYSGTSFPADTTLDFPTGMLERHNYLRQFHGSSTPMTWNPALAAAAQSEVNTCVFQHTANNIYGENLAGMARTGGYTPGQLVVSVDEWYGEIAQYDFSDPGFSTATGHFTQLVWLGSNELGCAWKDCTTTSLGLYFVACEYAPQGNIANAGYFQANVLPPVASVNSCAAGTTSNPGRVKKGEGETGYFRRRRMARELSPFF